MAKASKTNKKTSDKTRKVKRKSDKTVGGSTKASDADADKKPIEKTNAEEPKGFGLRLMDEIQNEGTVHHRAVAQVEALTKRNLVVYESFFSHPTGIIDDPDDGMIARLLTSIDLSKYPDTLDLMINSPGGSPTTAEKIILTCRSYADSFRVIVPQSAMSAATLVAMGANGILMTETAEVGPIDPQMRVQGPQGPILRPAAAWVDAYLDLVNKMQQAIVNKQPHHPFAEMLRKLDPSWIQVCMKARQLAEKIALDYLHKHMLVGKSEDDVRAVVKNFLTEGEEFSHGRAIRAVKAKEYGLNIETIENGSPLWEAVTTLHARCEHFVQTAGLAKYLVVRNGGIRVGVRQVQIS